MATWFLGRLADVRSSGDHLYASLATESGGAKYDRTRGLSNFLRRFLRLLLALVGVSVVFALFVFHRRRSREAKKEPEPWPPLYPEYTEWERRLPQHNMSLPSPEGEHAKFLWIPNHTQCKRAHYPGLYLSAHVSFRGGLGELHAGAGA